MSYGKVILVCDDGIIFAHKSRHGILAMSTLMVLNYRYHCWKREKGVNVNKFELDVMVKMVDLIIINNQEEKIKTLKLEVINMILKNMIQEHTVPDMGFPLLWKLGVTPNEFNNLTSKEEIDVVIDRLSKKLYKEFYHKVFSDSLELECIHYIYA